MVLWKAFVRSKDGLLQDVPMRSDIASHHTEYFDDEWATAEECSNVLAQLAANDVLLCKLEDIVLVAVVA